MSQIASTFGLAGGLDLVSPALAVAPSSLISGINYEPLAEGYGRVQGFERFDGRVAPSQTGYLWMSFNNGFNAIMQGQTVTGATSGATAIVVLEPIIESGSWGASNATGALILVNMTGAFVAGEYLVAAGVNRATVYQPAESHADLSVEEERAWSLAAQEWQRSLIEKVPGFGPVRGVAVFNGDVYAWRDYDATRARMYRATPTGWQQSSLGYTIPFTAGLVEIVEGEIVQGATSNATATVKRVIRQSGDWGSNAAGYLVVNAITGTFGNEIGRVGTQNRVTLAAATANTFPAGGRYTTINHNFYGATNRKALYGVNGVGPAFEFDGTTFSPIRTGMPIDEPQRVFEIAQHLGLTFPGGSVQLSGTGEPLVFDAVLGAAEIGLGTNITDVVQAAETSVILFGEEKVGVLSGRDAASFQLEELTEEAGAAPWTAQRIARTLYVDRRGLRDLSATAAYGNYKTGALSGLIEPLFRSKGKANAKPILSYVCKEKSQYRLIYDDGTGISAYMGRKSPEFLPFSLDDMRPFCVGTGEMDDGEGMFIGAEDGYVYRMDSGPSFDGTGIKGFIMTPFNQFGSAMQEDRFHKVTLECQAQPRTRIGVTVQYDYGDGFQPISGKEDFTVQGLGDGHDFVVSGGGGNWDSAIWDRFFWSAPFEGTAECFIDGIGRNASFIFACYSAPDEQPHILQAYTVHHSRRKVKR